MKMDADARKIGTTIKAFSCRKRLIETFKPLSPASVYILAKTGPVKRIVNPSMTHKKILKIARRIMQTLEIILRLSAAYSGFPGKVSVSFILYSPFYHMHNPVRFLAGYPEILMRFPEFS